MQNKNSYGYKKTEFDKNRICIYYRHLLCLDYRDIIYDYSEAPIIHGVETKNHEEEVQYINKAFSQFDASLDR